MMWRRTNAWAPKPSRWTYGPERASAMVLGTLALSVVLERAAGAGSSPLRFTPLLVGLAVAAGVYLLLLPAMRLYRTKDPEQAAALFNRASYYPLAMLGLALVEHDVLEAGSQREQLPRPSSRARGCGEGLLCPAPGLPRSCRRRWPGSWSGFPWLRRRPHPMLSHFPIVFLLSASFFSLLFVITGNRAFR